MTTVWYNACHWAHNSTKSFLYSQPQFGSNHLTTERVIHFLQELHCELDRRELFHPHFINNRVYLHIKQLGYFLSRLLLLRSQVLLVFMFIHATGPTLGKLKDLPRRSCSLERLVVNKVIQKHVVISVLFLRIELVVRLGVKWLWRHWLLERMLLSEILLV